MEAAVAETPKKIEPILYVTDKRHDRVLVIEGEDHYYNAAGRPAGGVEPTKLIFKDGECKVSLYDGPLERYAGRAVVRGKPQGMDFDAMIAAVEEHRWFDHKFWRAGLGPKDARPTMDELRELIETASPGELKALLKQERSTHNRREALGLIAEKSLGGDDDGDPDDLR